MRARVKSKFYAGVYHSRPIAGISEEAARVGLEFVVENPETTSEYLEAAEGCFASTQESYGSEKAAVEISQVAQDRKKRRKQD